MKNSIFLLLLLLLFLSSQAIGQGLLGIQWNDTDIGHNIGVFYEATTEDFKIGAGFTVLLNNQPDGAGHAYHKRASARSLKEKLGVNFSLSYPIYRYKQSFVLRGMYRAFYANTRFSSFDNSQRIVSHEHYLGLKVDIPISNRMVLTQSAGGGMAFFRSPNRFPSERFGAWELSYMITVGLGYQFGYVD